MHFLQGGAAASGFILIDGAYRETHAGGALGGGDLVGGGEAIELVEGGALGGGDLVGGGEAIELVEGGALGGGDLVGGGEAIELVEGGALVGGDLVGSSAVSESLAGGAYGGGEEEVEVPLTGEVKAFGGLVLPTGYLDCDGAAISRTTYSFLRLVLSYSDVGTRTNGSATVTGLTSTAGLSAGCPVEGTGFAAGTLIMGVLGPTSVSLTNVATGNGLTNLIFFPWGAGDGSTTFNVPDLRRKGLFGMGGSATAILGDAMGNTGGAETHTLTSPAEIPSHSHNFGSTSGGTSAVPTTGGPFTAAGSSFATTATGSGGAHNNLQPSTIVRWIIKT